MGIPKGQLGVRGITDVGVSGDTIVNPFAIGAVAGVLSDSQVNNHTLGALAMTSSRALYVNLRDRTTDRGVSVDTSNRLMVNVGNVVNVLLTAGSGTFVLDGGANTIVSLVQTTNWSTVGNTLMLLFQGDFIGTISFFSCDDVASQIAPFQVYRHSTGTWVTSIVAGSALLDVVSVNISGLRGLQMVASAVASGTVTGSYFTYIASGYPTVRLPPNTGVDIGNVGVSGQVTVTAAGGPLTDVCGVNRTGSAMNVFIAGASAGGNVPINLAGAGIDTSNSAVAVSVRAGVLGNVAITQVSGALTGGGISVSANGGSFAVSANNPGANQNALRGDAVFNALVSNPVKFATIETPASAGNHSIVALVASRRIKVLGYTLVADVSAQVCFRDATAAGAKLTGSMSLASHGGASPAVAPWGQFQTNVSHALVLHQSVATTVAGHLTYVESF